MAALEILPTSIKDIKRIRLKLFSDARGFFMESYNKKVLFDQAGIAADFVQDNHSKSAQNVLRGLHYQLEKPQGKLVRVIKGKIFDVAVDIRKSSPTFGQWVGMTLTEADPELVWIPEGFAHGFLALVPDTEVLYKTTEFYDPKSERCIVWNDPQIAIIWPSGFIPLLSPKDSQGVMLNQADLFS